MVVVPSSKTPHQTQKILLEFPVGGFRFSVARCVHYLVVKQMTLGQPLPYDAYGVDDGYLPRPLDGPTPQVLQNMVG